MQQDEIVYQSGNIIISKTLARFGGVTYPVNGIGSVYVAKPKRLGMLLFGGVAVLIGLLVASGNADGTIGVVISGVGCLVVLAAFGQPHKLMLRTASGDQQAYESRNANEVLDIKTAIETAVVMRG